MGEMELARRSWPGMGGFTLRTKTEVNDSSRKATHSGKSSHELAMQCVASNDISSHRIGARYARTGQSECSDFFAIGAHEGILPTEVDR